MSEVQPANLAALDAQTEHALSVFLQRLEGRYSVRESILFGSRARQTHRPDSDVDLAVVLEGESGDRSAAVRDMAAIAFDVMLETDVLVSPLPLWAGEFDRPDALTSGLIRSIRHDGLRL